MIDENTLIGDYSVKFFPEGMFYVKNPPHINSTFYEGNLEILSKVAIEQGISFFILRNNENYRKIVAIEIKR